MLTPSDSKSRTALGKKQNRTQRSRCFKAACTAAEQLNRSVAACVYVFLSTERRRERRDVWRSGQYLSTYYCPVIPPANVDIDRSRRDTQKHQLDSGWNIMAGFTDTSMSKTPTETHSLAARWPRPLSCQHFFFQNRLLHAATAPVSLIDAPVIVNTWNVEYKEIRFSSHLSHRVDHQRESGFLSLESIAKVNRDSEFFHSRAEIHVCTRTCTQH